MNVVKCKNNHYYDADRFDSCPHCDKAEQLSKRKKTEADAATHNSPFNDKTVPLPEDENKSSEGSKAESAEEKLEKEVRKVTSDNGGKTIGFFSFGDDAENEIVDPVVGWLVCVSGIHIGECFNIYAGRNSVGRNSSNRIVISNDNKVSREKHAWITFDPRSGLYYIQPGDSSGMTYLNDAPVMESNKVKNKDIILIGDGKYVFVPLCGDDFSWEDYM